MVVVAVGLADAVVLEGDAAADGGSSDHAQGWKAIAHHSRHRPMYIALVLYLCHLLLLLPYPLQHLHHMILTMSGHCPR